MADVVCGPLYVDTINPGVARNEVSKTKQNKTNKKKTPLLSSCFDKRIYPKSILNNRNVFLVKAALEMVQEAVQLWFRKTKGQLPAHHPRNRLGNGLSLGKTCKM